MDDKRAGDRLHRQRGVATWVFGPRANAAPLKGKVLPWTAKATGPGTFSVDDGKTD